jgi:acetyl esterase/lipase
VPYGTDPEQWGELWLPGGTTKPLLGVAVLLHGGFWRSPYTCELMRPLAEDLARRRIAALNLEYRRVGCAGGGWPGTLADVALGIDALAELPTTVHLDLDAVVVVGHSAGGQMALWAAARHTLAPGEVGSQPAVRPALAVSLAGLCDLPVAAQQSLGEGATVEFMGGTPEDRPEAYRHASPSERLPLGVPQLLIHGDADPRVPQAMTKRYAQAARESGDRVEVLLYEGVDHLGLIDPTSAPWREVVARAWP